MRSFGFLHLSAQSVCLPRQEGCRSLFTLPPTSLHLFLFATRKTGEQRPFEQNPLFAPCSPCPQHEEFRLAALLSPPEDVLLWSRLDPVGHSATLREDPDLASVHSTNLVRVVRVDETRREVVRRHREWGEAESQSFRCMPRESKTIKRMVFRGPERELPLLQPVKVSSLDLQGMEVILFALQAREMPWRWQFPSVFLPGTWTSDK